MYTYPIYIYIYILTEAHETLFAVLVEDKTSDSGIKKSWNKKIPTFFLFTFALYIFAHPFVF